ncbi:MAG: pyruvate:ferredoxin (flavodoxin) oxidoreductase [Myxococcales bacterium]|jgi:pyruvate-ferredoxin/flavodoxin oxidoreductase|nr:pyruvate:ferredoxin (flavodoxin) oxidoreductase [Myxococcales bacterium]
MSNTPEGRKPKLVTIDGNTAAAHIAHAVSEVIAIYPITPSSTMGEISDEKSARGEKNIFGTVPLVAEMQSEGGAVGAVHGALQAGALTTTFTASQGLLLMIPNMYKIAGELTPTVFHVTARALATHALSIFGDHSDVMSTRQTGFAMLASGSVQEVMDLALVSHAATLKARVPFLHFFDGFRTSHEIQKVEELSFDDIRALVDEKCIVDHKARALSPDHPVMRGTAQNPDVYFQGRERSNGFYLATPGIVQDAMDQLGAITGRHYHLFDYVGAPDAEQVLVLMGSGAEVAEEAIDALVAKGEKVGAVKVRLYRPFSVEHFIKALPATTKAIAVLDRTKEPGSAGEPLYADVQMAIAEMLSEGKTPFKAMPKVIGGRYGLGSKEFTPAMVKGVFDNLKAAQPKNHFVVGITDDLTNTSIDYDESFSTEPAGTFRGLFYGLGSDGTVGANKNSIKIIGDETDNYAQGYFVYDSKKSGSMTVSHLRFGKEPIRASYLISNANFIASHMFDFLEKFDMLKLALPGATLLLNAPYTADELWDHLPGHVQEQILAKQLKLYTIDANKVAEATGMGTRINTIMQTCFFYISGILPPEEAIAQIKKAIKKTYGKRGEHVVEQNYRAVDETIANLHAIDLAGKKVTNSAQMPLPVPANAPEFVQSITGKIIAGQGDALPVSAFPEDGTYPTATSQFEKRNVALHVPAWDPSLCIQCGKCSIVCPHAAIRTKIYTADKLSSAPASFKAADAKDKEFAGQKFTVQCYVEDCAGCGACVEICPAKSKADPSKKALTMVPQLPLRETGREEVAFFETLPDVDRAKVKADSVKGSQLLKPLFEFSGACAGCGETPYVKLLTQLFGDRALIANATGCSSIYGGNLPTTPYAKDAAGRGPAWANSLFEDNAEFGYGMRLAVDKFNEQAKELLTQVDALKAHPQLIDALKDAPQVTEADIAAQRERVAELKKILAGSDAIDAQRLSVLADYLVKKSVWIMGGDGWAYDIGYGGLDHVLAQGRKVNVLVLDTEVYSNTGGQMSKATPMGAVAKFAAAGKHLPEKDMGLIAMSYGYIYVAQVAMGANDLQTVKAFLEAEAYDGPSLILAYSHCIAHGIDMRTGMQNQKRAVQSGHWPLYRYNPALALKGENPLKIDSKAPSISFEDFAYQEGRWKMLTKSDPKEAQQLLEGASMHIQRKWQYLDQLSKMHYGSADAAKAE